MVEVKKTKGTEVQAKDVKIINESEGCGNGVTQSIESTANMADKAITVVEKAGNGELKSTREYERKIADLRVELEKKQSEIETLVAGQSKVEIVSGRNNYISGMSIQNVVVTEDLKDVKESIESGFRKEITELKEEIRDGRDIIADLKADKKSLIEEHNNKAKVASVKLENLVNDNKAEIARVKTEAKFAVEDFKLAAQDVIRNSITELKALRKSVLRDSFSLRSRKTLEGLIRTSRDTAVRIEHVLQDAVKHDTLFV